VLAFAVIALVTFRAVTGPDPAIAVLPFLPLEEDAVASRTGLSFQAHVTEARTELTRGDARIIGPASNVPGANGSALDGSDRARAAALGAQYVVSGTITPDGERSIVFAQLVRISDGAHLFAGRASALPDSLEALARAVSERAWRAAQRR
jgi:TolB-like protein